MRFTHVFITRPQSESRELAALLAPLDLQVITQPAFDFEKLHAASEQSGVWHELESAQASPLLVFTSKRSVSFALDQLPAGLITKCKIAAIGPSTSEALDAAGVQVNIRPASGFTSEALLEVLQEDTSLIGSCGKSAFILAAPGGRRKMEEGLAELGWDTKVLMVYRRQNAEIDKQKLSELNAAGKVLSVWTSGNSMTALSQRLPPTTWFRLCQGEWLVISDRLRRLARAYGPAKIHLSAGPGNRDLFSAIRVLNTDRES